MEYYTIVKSHELAYVLTGIILKNITLNDSHKPDLTGVAQWVGHHPTSQKFAVLISSQNTCLGCGPGPQLGACKRQLINVSLPVFLPPFTPL